MDDKIVTLDIFYDPMLAEIIRGRLAANGIDCFIADDINVGLNLMYNIAFGGVKLRVFERDVEKCRQILAEDITLPDEPEIASETVCPYCHSANVRYGAATIRKTNWLGVIISFLFFTYPFYARKAWHCFNCGRDFDK
jgi:hypothetical protein